MVRLFDIEHVSSDDLNNADFDFFKSGELLTTGNEDYINKFYAILYDDKRRVPFYHCLPLVNSVTNEKKFRFMLVKVNNDVVFFSYKIIQIVKTKQIRVFDEPISLNRDDKNVEIVIQVLKNKSFVKFVYADFINNELLDTSTAERLVEYDNYYYTRRHVMSMSHAKLKKRGIIDLLESSKFKIVVSESIDHNDALTIRNDFNRYLVDSGRKTSNANDNDYYKLATICDDALPCISIYYNNKIVYNSVFVILRDLRVAYKLYDMQSRYYEHDDIILDRMMSLNMTEKMKYLAFMFLKDIDVIYILGCRPNEHRLIKHKEMKCEGKIKYYIQ